MTKHRQTKTREFKTWTSLRQRCFNPKSQSYSRYGGRGITVCERWNNFQNFLDDMGKRPQGKSIDRIDNDGNYEPSNCRWATSKEQNSNRRSVQMYTYNGKTNHIRGWAQEVGIKHSTLANRIRKYGLSFQEAITRKPYAHLIGNNNNHRV